MYQNAVHDRETPNLDLKGTNRHHNGHMGQDNYFKLL